MAEGAADPPNGSATVAGGKTNLADAKGSESSCEEGPREPRVVSMAAEDGTATMPANGSMLGGRGSPGLRGVAPKGSGPESDGAEGGGNSTGREEDRGSATVAMASRSQAAPTDDAPSPANGSPSSACGADVTAGEAKGLLGGREFAGNGALPRPKGSIARGTAPPIGRGANGSAPLIEGDGSGPLALGGRKIPARGTPEAGDPDEAGG